VQHPRYDGTVPIIPITRSIAIDEDELSFTATRAGGAGGQHVNTTDSAVLLRFDLAASPSLPDAVKHRLASLAGSRLTREGVLVLREESSRSQHLNRAAVVERLVAIIREATIVQPKRRPTKPTRASQTRRVDGKARRGAIKSLRGKPVD